MFEYPFEMAANTATMVVVKKSTGQILLGKRKDSSEAFPGAWCLPGGYLNVGEERLIVTASRELNEECNINLGEDRWDLFYCDDKPGSDPRYKQVVNSCFYAFICDEEAKNAKAGDDIQEVKWVNVWEARKMELAFAHNDVVWMFMIQTPNEKV